MTVMLITAVQAAETLARFHCEQVDKTPPGPDQDHHRDMARHCAEDAEQTKGWIEAAGVTVENQDQAVRSRDMEVAHRIIDRHPIMHGAGMATEAVAAARVAMARDIADAIHEARGGLPLTPAG
jgi:hypothetical protein